MQHRTKKIPPFFKQSFNALLINSVYLTLLLVTVSLKVHAIKFAPAYKIEVNGKLELIMKRKINAQGHVELTLERPPEATGYSLAYAHHFPSFMRSAHSFNDTPMSTLYRMMRELLDYWAYRNSEEPQS